MTIPQNFKIRVTEKHNSKDIQILLAKFGVFWTGMNKLNIRIRSEIGFEIERGTLFFCSSELDFENINVVELSYSQIVNYYLEKKINLIKYLL
jgi:hypothetical protein